MLASKQIAFGKAAGAAKPYKARLEYLESTGTQYIDTGIPPNSNTIVEIDFLLSEVSTMGIFGSRVAARDNSFLMFVVNGYFRYDIGTSFVSVSTVLPNGNSEYRFVGRKDSYFIQDLTSGTEQQMGVPVSTISSAYSIALFAVNTKGIIGTYAKAKIRSFKLKENDTLIQSLIPVLDNADTPCMYDEVRGEFFYNQGEGEFIAGPEI